MRVRSTLWGYVLGACALLASAIAHADEAHVQECLARAASTFDVDLVALQILRELEGGQAGSASANTNGTYDYGPMQINSRWAGVLAQVGVSMESVRDDECVNAFVAAWIFRDALQATSSTAMTIARYHSSTPHFQERYLSKALDVVRRQRTQTENQSHSPMEQQK